MMSESRLPSASIENEFLRLDYLTTTGPRIVGLYLRGVSGNILAETPDVHWGTPHGEFYLRGGHRLWAAPENPSYICPEDGLSVIEDHDGVVLKGFVDACGLEKQITIHLNGNCVHLSHQITWHGNDPIELAPWGITQLRLGGMAIIPLSNEVGLLPNRNLVLWPYSQIKDERLDLHDDLVLIKGYAAQQALKIGNYNSHGWIACLFPNILFIKRFPVNKTGKYPDLGCNVEVYVKDSCLELESLGTLKTNESLTHEETWEIIAGEYPATLESARSISRQLSQTQNEWSRNG